MALGAERRLLLFLADDLGVEFLLEGWSPCSEVFEDILDGGSYYSPGVDSAAELIPLLFTFRRSCQSS